MWAKISDLVLLSMLARFPAAATTALSSMSAAALKVVQDSFNSWDFQMDSNLWNTTLRSIHPLNLIQLLLSDSAPVYGQLITVGSCIISLQSRLGQGSQGTTFLGQCQDESQVVVKIFNPYCTIRNPQEAFNAEVDVLKRLGRYIDSDKDKMIIVQDYIQGPILHSVLESLNPSNPIERQLMTRLFLKYLEAVVSFSFQTGYTHNDASALNAILCNDQIVLIDFGLATLCTQVEIGSTRDFDYAFRELTIDFPTVKSQLLEL